MPLEAEILDRLLADRALGALPPDVDALIEAYLEHDPAGRDAACQMAEVIDMARRSLTDAGVEAEDFTHPVGSTHRSRALALPRFPARALRASLCARRVARVAAGASALAACLTLGAALGAALFAHGARVRSPAHDLAGGPPFLPAAGAGQPATFPVMEHRATGLRNGARSAEAGLWSQRRMLARIQGARRDPVDSRPPLKWTSPIKLPVITGETGSGT